MSCPFCRTSAQFATAMRPPKYPPIEKTLAKARIVYCRLLPNDVTVLVGESVGTRFSGPYFRATVDPDGRNRSISGGYASIEEARG